MEIILKYFPDLSSKQREQFAQLAELYRYWNEQINVISRKDIDQLYERHVLHSLGIAMVMQFSPGAAILDVGTGGGFPGIPLAILFPEANFHLVDSIGKKIKVVREVAKALGLTNIKAEQIRAEEVRDKYDFVVSRAVTQLGPFYNWVRNKFNPANSRKYDNQRLSNGILYLKGGEVAEELRTVPSKYRIFDLSLYFEEPFFATKKLIYLPIV